MFVCTHKTSFPFSYQFNQPPYNTHMIWNETKRSSRHFKRFISSSAATINRSAFIHWIQCEMLKWRCSPCLYKTYCFRFCLFWIKCESMLNFSFSVEFFTYLPSHSLPAFEICLSVCICMSNIRYLECNRAESSIVFATSNVFTEQSNGCHCQWQQHFMHCLITFSTNSWNVNFGWYTEYSRSHNGLFFLCLSSLAFSGGVRVQPPSTYDAVSFLLLFFLFTRPK